MSWKVIIIESELGWGQRIDGVRDFDSYEAANAFVNSFNEENNDERAPDWYMYAQPPVEVKA